MNDEPLIYTILGNIPIKDLKFEYWWIENDDVIEYHTRYLLGDDVVKQGCAVKVKRTPPLFGEQGVI